jgi:hypothetical protein
MSCLMPACAGGSQRACQGIADTVLGVSFDVPVKLGQPVMRDAAGFRQLVIQDAHVAQPLTGAHVEPALGEQPAALALGQTGRGWGSSQVVDVGGHTGGRQRPREACMRNPAWDVSSSCGAVCVTHAKSATSGTNSACFRKCW